MSFAAIDVVTAAAITGGGPTQTITGSLGGLTPKAVIIYATRGVTVGTIIDGAMLSVGMTDGTNQFVNSWVAEDGASNGAGYHTNRRHDNAKLVQINDTAGAGVLDGEASFSSFSANSVTISWNNLPSTAVQLVVVFFYGTGMNASVGTVTAPAAVDTSVTATGVPFQPTAVLFASGINGYAAGGSTATSAGSLGVAALVNGSIVQSTLGWLDRDTGGTTSTVDTTMIRNDTCLARLQITAGGTGSILSTGDLTAFTPDGFTLFTRTGSSAIVSMYLALETGVQRVWVGNPALTTSTTGDKTITSPGWQPTALFMCGSIITSVNSQRDNSEATHLSIGVATASSQASASYQVEDGSGTSDTRCLVDSKIAVLPDDGGTVDWSGSLTTFDPTGFTINVGDASDAGSARDCLVWAFAIEQPQLPVTDTENISESLAFTRKEALSETEQLSDASVLVVTINRRVSNDTENISDAFVVVRKEALAETEQISDTAILALSFGGRIVAEIEQIGDDFAIVRKEALSDTEQITDAAILIRGSFTGFQETEELIDSFVTVLMASAGAIVATDTEQVSDAAILVQQTAMASFQDTERITDQALLYLGRVMVVNEVVNILEGFVGGGTSGLRAIKLKRAGRVFQW